jgi:hypothetical protein
LEDPTLEYKGKPPLNEPDAYYRDNIGAHVHEYFKYPLDPQLFIERLKGLDTNRY